MIVDGFHLSIKMSIGQRPFIIPFSERANFCLVIPDSGNCRYFDKRHRHWHLCLLSLFLAQPPLVPRNTHSTGSKSIINFLLTFHALTGLQHLNDAPTVATLHSMDRAGPLQENWNTIGETQ
jgi:hypothetical protein